MTRIVRTLVDRLRDERGMALVMAIGIATVLAIAGASLVLYSMTNEHHANRSRSDLRGYNLAQSGIENAVAQIANVGDLDGDGAADPDSPTIFSTLPASSKTEAFGTGEQVVWDAQLWDDRPNPPVLYAPSGNPFYIPKLRWHITSVSTVPNPAAPSANVTRRLQSDLVLVPAKEQPIDSDAWRYVYSREDDGNLPWRPGDNYEPAGCDITLPNNPNVAASFYVSGDLCLENNSQIIGGTGDPVEVIVHGWVVNRSPQAWVGTSTNPTDARTRIGGMCWHRNRSPKNPAAGPPGPPVGCWFSEHFVPDATDSPSVVTAPTADFPGWYELGSPGPNDPCDPALSSGSWPQFDDPDPNTNGNLPTLNLVTMPAFHCETARGGILDWDPSTSRLRVEGTMYYDGSIDLFASVTPVDIEYTGVGAIYTSGSVRLHQVRLCADWSGTVCDSGWNGIGPMLLIAANGSTNSWASCPNCGILLETSSGFQGALYATHNIGLQNLSLVQGPMIAQAEIISNQFTFYPIPEFTRVPFGTPQTPIVNWNLLPPTNYQG